MSPQRDWGNVVFPIDKLIPRAILNKVLLVMLYSRVFILLSRPSVGIEISAIV